MWKQAAERCGRLLQDGVRLARRWTIEFTRKRRQVSCNDGCYRLNDGTLVPLGDLGVTPTEYRLRP